MRPAAAFQNAIIAKKALQKALESRGAGSELVEDEEGAMKSESVVGTSTQDPCNDITTMFASFVVVMRA